MPAAERNALTALPPKSMISPWLRVKTDLSVNEADTIHKKPGTLCGVFSAGDCTHYKTAAVGGHVPVLKFPWYSKLFQIIGACGPL